MVKAMETNFFGMGCILEKGQDYAFSHTTPDGSTFASKHTGGYFLTYKPKFQTKFIHVIDSLPYLKYSNKRLMYLSKVTTF